MDEFTKKELGLMVDELGDDLTEISDWIEKRTQLILACQTVELSAEQKVENKALEERRDRLAAVVEKLFKLYRAK